ncbi:YoaK family protein [Micromonospora sp. NPDC049559]|uniref:YoaK family protein n=1 Tax=Micromonospora sp. NPDC049559 TaxID=3155923 RepID=UPI0034252169
MAGNDPGRTGASASTPDRALPAVVVVLSLAAGVTDAISLLHLGGVFSSVITGNLVVLGVSAAGVEVPTLVRVATAVGLYGLGVFAGARLAALRRFAPASGGAPPRHGGEPASGAPRWRASAACLAVEAVLLAVLWAGWLAAGGAPEGTAQVPLIALAGLAMGVQSVAVQALGRSGLSTTYLTGALTRLVSATVGPGRRHRFDGTQALALAGVVLGAGLAALLARHLHWAGPLPAALLAATAAGIALTSATRRRPG